MHSSLRPLSAILLLGCMMAVQATDAFALCRDLKGAQRLLAASQKSYGPTLKLLPAANTAFTQAHNSGIVALNKYAAQYPQ